MAMSSEPVLRRELNERRLDDTRFAVNALTGYVGANLLGGAIGACLSRKPHTRAFHATNALFNVQTLGFALLGKWLLSKQDASRMSATTNLRRGLKLERGLMAGVALDVATIGAGAFLLQRGAARRSPKLRGTGAALLLQGVLLLAYDAAFTWMERGHTDRTLRLVT